MKELQLLFKNFYFKQFCPYIINNKTSVHVTKTTIMKKIKHVPIVSKLTVKKAIDVYHAGDKEVRKVKAAINKIVQSFSQKSFKSRYMIYNL